MAGERKIIFVVTGFGAFADVAENPTQTIIAKLRERLPHLSYRHTDDEIVPVPVHYHVLEVSVDHCNAFVNEKLAVEALASEGETEVVCVHLGVDARGACIKLEQCAYNNQTFRVPDFRGFQPQGVKIDERLSLDEARVTDWDLPALRESIINQNEGLCLALTGSSPSLITVENNEKTVEKLQISTDPGRYLCNYIFFRTLSLKNEEKLEKTKVHSLFVHVPPFEVIDEVTQVEFVETLLKQMLARLAQ